MSVTDALHHYRDCLNHLALDSQITKDDVVKIFIARDAVAEVMPSLTTWQCLQLWIWDRKLRGFSDRLASAFTATFSLEQCAVSKRYNSQYWWWYLKPKTREWWESYEGLFDLVRQASLVGSIPLIIDISAKFLIPGVELWGLVSLALQGVVTWGTGKNLVTAQGQADLKKWAIILGFGDRAWYVVGAFTSMGWLVSLLLFQIISYQCWSQHYLVEGKKGADADQFTKAEENFERSLLFNPDNQITQYELGKLYDRLSDYEKSQKLYQKIFESPPAFTAPQREQLNYFSAAHKLGRTWILKKNPRTAMWILKHALNRLSTLIFLNQLLEARISQDTETYNTLLDRPGLRTQKSSEITRFLESEITPDPDIYIDSNYFIARTLGWSKLELKMYSSAEINLDQSLVLAQRSKSLSINEERLVECLLGRLFQEDNRLAKAIQSWNQCKRISMTEEYDNPEWLYWRLLAAHNFRLECKKISKEKISCDKILHQQRTSQAEINRVRLTLEKYISKIQFNYGRMQSRGTPSSR